MIMTRKTKMNDVIIELSLQECENLYYLLGYIDNDDLDDSLSDSRSILRKLLKYQLNKNN